VHVHIEFEHSTCMHDKCPAQDRTINYYMAVYIISYEYNLDAESLQVEMADTRE